MKNQFLLKASSVLFFVSLFIFSFGNVSALEMISFDTPPTPLGSATITSNPEVKISTTDSEEHYVLNDINNSLVGWWRGEGNLNDDSSKGNIATWNGTPSYSSGKFGQAFNFDGSGKSIEIPSQSYFSATNGSITVSLWARVPVDAPAVGDGGLDPAGNNGAYLITKTGNGGYEWGLENDNNNKICYSYWTSNNVHNCANFTFNDGVFHHFVFIANDTDNFVKLYVDGNLLISDVTPSIFSSTNSDIIIGSRSEGSPSFAFNGLIDDVTLFNRSLSSGEVKSLYDASNYQYDETLANLNLDSNIIKGYTVGLDGTYYSTSRTFNAHISPAMSVASQGTGTYFSTQTVSLSSLRSTSIVYSKSAIPEGELCDGTTSSIYSGPISVPMSNVLYVRACNPYGFTDTSFTYIQMVPPEAPTGVGRISGSYSDFTLGWTPPVNNTETISSYDINFHDELPNSGNNGYDARNVTSYQFPSGVFLPGHTYDFTVKAYNDAGWGIDSQIFTYTFPDAGSYVVSSCSDLQNINNDKYGHYTLSKNLDCGETTTWNQGEGDYQGFLPIGTSGEETSGEGFNGTFNGNNHTISGIYINRPYDDYIGLFGMIDVGGSVSNLGLINANINGSNYVGILAGDLAGTVTNVYTTGQVDGSSQVGGLVGINQKLIKDSYTTGDVSVLSDNGGGLVGVNTDNGDIENSYAAGNVTAGNNFEANIGGLVGNNDNQNAVIKNSYATGNVIGTEYVSNSGGFAGVNYGTITNSYSTGTASGNYYVGGFIGNDNTCFTCGVNNSFSTGDVSQLGTISDGLYIGGFIGGGSEFNYVSGSGDGTGATGNNNWYNTTQTIAIGDDRGEDSQPQKVENISYFKGLEVKSKIPFIGYWDFTQTPIWYTRSNDYPKLTTEIIPTCYDGIQNQNETGIDSGGVCTSEVHYQSSSGSYLPGYGPNAVNKTQTVSEKSNPISKFIFVKQNQIGSRNNEVKELQKYLNAHGFVIALKGIGSVGNESNYFGKATRDALGSYQIKNKIIKSKKSKGYGVMGPATRRFINSEQ